MRNKTSQRIAAALAGGALVAGLTAPHSIAQDPPHQVDRYGQVASADWPGKVTQDSQLRQDARREGRYYESLPDAPTNVYGGDAHTKRQLKLRRTGFFHVQKVGGRSILVDPMGQQFFSLGVNVVSTGDTYTKVAGRESSYEWLPPRTGTPLSAGWMADNDENFSFYVANQVRKYGSYSRDAFYARSIDRLDDMGFNTVGGFSDLPEDGPRFPYVAHLDEVPDHWVNGIYDVYRPGLEQELATAMAEQIGNRKDDRYLIGYMFFNEINWANLRTAVSSSSVEESHTKRALVDLLRKRHHNDIASFNGAWGMSAASFDDLLTASFTPRTDAAVADMDAFSERYLDRFYKLFSTAVRSTDPNHMVIGDRWFTKVMEDAKLRRQVVTAAGRHLDAMTYNYYAWDPSTERLSEMYRYGGGKPFIVTEFHYGEPTRGLTFAINMAKNEDDKGRLYRHYVEKMAASGMVVGTHWFEYLDQAPTGRWFQGYNGEAGAIGLIDVTDRPYRTLLDHVSATNASIYKLVNGQRAPFPYTFSANQTERDSNQQTVVPRATTAPLIDGALDPTWPAGPTLQLGAGDLTDGVAQAGVGADFRLSWDAQNLYLHATVADATPMRNRNHGFDIWDGDAIELFVGGSNVDQGGGIQVTDNQVIISAQPQDAQGTAEAYWYNGRKDQPTIDAVVKPAQGGYTLEAAIPISALNVDVSDIPKQLRFDIGFDDGDGQSRQRQFLWNGVEGNSANREKWGRAWLVETPNDSLPGQEPSSPSIRLLQRTAAQGDYVSVTATGMNPGETIALHLGKERVATLRADDAGDALAWVRIPTAGRPGRQTLQAVRDGDVLWSQQVRVTKK